MFIWIVFHISNFFHHFTSGISLRLTLNFSLKSPFTFLPFLHQRLFKRHSLSQNFFGTSYTRCSCPWRAHSFLWSVSSFSMFCSDLSLICWYFQQPQFSGWKICSECKFDFSKIFLTMCLIFSRVKRMKEIYFYWVFSLLVIRPNRDWLFL